jgi:hypothetical protein
MKKYRMAPYVLFTLFFYLLISAVAADPSVSIAAAYDAEINDGWARYVYWLRPDGKIMMQGRDIAPIEREEIQQTVKPQDNSPLAALYRRKDTGAREVSCFIFYSFSAFTYHPPNSFSSRTSIKRVI